uniref:Uncharacterized protein n=1 Tax=Heterosigma akashiwo TaxID=2829 RepID=A0A7S4DIQ5_HETAK
MGEGQSRNILQRSVAGVWTGILLIAGAFHPFQALQLNLKAAGGDVKPRVTSTGITRGAFLQGTGITLTAGVLTFGIMSQPSVAYPSYPQAYRVTGPPASFSTWLAQLEEGEKILVNVLQNWKDLELRDNGDEVRKFIGTVGPVSALNPVSLKRAFLKLAEADDFPDYVDLDEYAEKYEEVLTALADAENEAYSANFADFSGGGQLKSSQFIKRSQKRIAVAQRALKEILAMFDV